jgi:hypothetical protein
MDNGALYQVIHPYRPGIYEPEIVDISCHVNPEEAFDRKKNKAIRVLSNLNKGPLVRFFLFKVRPGEDLFIAVVHHIISDAASLDIIGSGLVALYRQFRSGARPDNYPGYHLRDIVRRQQAITPEKEKHYWLGQLQGYVGTVTDSHRRSSGFWSYTHPMAPQLPGIIRATAATLGVSSFAVLLAAFYLFFYTCENRRQTLFAISVSDRRGKRDKDVIGHLMYKIYLGRRIGPEIKISQFIRNVYLDFLRACCHPMYNEWNYDQLPICRATALYLNYLPKRKPNQVKARVHQDCSPSCYGLSCFIEDFQDVIRLGWIYDSALFDPGDIERMTREYEYILGYACGHVDKIINELQDIAGKSPA